MAIVAVQVGQCGNQLGDELFTQLAISVASAREANGSLDSPFFCNDGMARCVLIDSEPKVVKGVLARHQSFIRPENVVCGQSGRGNNWGMGFYGVKETEERSAAVAPPPPPSRKGGQDKKQPPASGRRGSAAGAGFQKVYKAQRTEDGQLLTNALRAVHRETRRTADSDDGFEAILLLHSLSGGTGSGLASRLAEKIRFYFIQPPPGEPIDERREANMMLADGLDGMLVEKRRARYLVDIAVAPQACGELALQGINAALTLHRMHHFADATLLLRNDDVMAPSGAISRSTTKTTNIVQRCLTFKEANEVLVAMLMPILRYGISGSCSSSAMSRAGRGGGQSLRRRGGGGRGQGNPHGAIATIVRNCAPTSSGGYERVLRMTGGNTILTLLPTPQNTYEGYKRSLLRCVFFTVEGGKDFMPGCFASIPLDTMCAKAALPGLPAGVIDNANGRGFASSPVGQRRGTPGGRPHPQQQQQRQVRLSQQGSPLGGRARYGRTPVKEEEDRPVWDSSGLEPSRPPKLKKGDVDLRFDRDDDDDCKVEDEDARDSAERDGAVEREGRRGAEAERQELREEGEVYTEIAMRIPPRLLTYYNELTHSPVASLSKSLEGVAVLNQARELNSGLLFPLLKSAALKVKVGAFLYTYEKAGVKADAIVTAYQEVAEFLSLAEEL